MLDKFVSLGHLLNPEKNKYTVAKDNTEIQVYITPEDYCSGHTLTIVGNEVAFIDSSEGDNTHIAALKEFILICVTTIEKEEQ